MRATAGRDPKLVEAFALGAVSCRPEEAIRLVILEEQCAKAEERRPRRLPKLTVPGPLTYQQFRIFLERFDGVEVKAAAPAGPGAQQEKEKTMTKTVEVTAKLTGLAADRLAGEVLGQVQTALDNLTDDAAVVDLEDEADGESELSLGVSADVADDASADDVLANVEQAIKDAGYTAECSLHVAQEEGANDNGAGSNAGENQD